MHSSHCTYHLHSGKLGVTRMHPNGRILLHTLDISAHHRDADSHHYDHLTCVSVKLFNHATKVRNFA